MRKAGWSLTLPVVSIALVCLALQVPSQLQAQVLKGSKGPQMEIIPFAGGFVPLGHLIDQGGLVIKHRPTVVFGGRFDAWLSKQTGLEVVVGYAPSGYRGESSGFGSSDTSGSHLSVSARFLYRLGAGGASTWHLMVGGGFVKHGGAGVEGLTGTTDLSGVVGIAGRFHISPSLALQVTAEDYLYSAKFGVSGISGETESKLNNDLMVSLGLVVPLGSH